MVLLLGKEHCFGSTVPVKQRWEDEFDMKRLVSVFAWKCKTMDDNGKRLIYILQYKTDS